MSRSSSVEFRGRLLWAQTEGLQVWLALLVEAANELEARYEPWFSELTNKWRVQASVADLGCTLMDSWSAEQVSVVVQLAKQTRVELSEPGVADRLLLPRWSVLDDLPVAGGVDPRRLVERIDQVADAFIHLLEETLPSDPPGAAWGVGWGHDMWEEIPMLVCI